MSFVGHTAKGTAMRPLREGTRIAATYPVAFEERFSKLSVWADGKGPGSSSDQVIRGGVYDGNNQLVAVTEDSVIPHGSDATWYTLRASSPILLPPDTYTLAVQAGPVDGSARIGFQGWYDDFLTDELNSYHYDLNTSFEANATGWTTDAGTLVGGITPPVASPAGAGSKAGRVTSDGAFTVLYQSPYTTTFPTTDGEVWTASMYSLAATTTNDFKVQIAWLDATGTAVFPSSDGSLTTNSAASWTRHSVTATAPVGAKYARIQIRASSAVANGVIHYFDGAMIERSGTLNDWHDYSPRPGTLTISGGQLVPLTTDVVAFHTTTGAADAQVTLETQTGTTFTGVSGVVLKRKDATNYIAVRYTVGELQIVKVDAGVESVMENFPMVLSPNTNYWLRGRIVGNTITAEHFSEDPALSLSPEISISEILAGADAVKFGLGVEGTFGVRVAPSDTAWRWGSFMIATQPVGVQTADPYIDGISNAVGITNVCGQPAIWLLTFVPPAIAEIEEDEYLASLPHSVAQQVLGRHGPLDLPAISATVGWHGTLVDAEIGAFALVNPNGPLAHLVGERVEVEVSANADVHLSTVGGIAIGVNLAVGAEVAPAGTKVNVLVHASADVVEDITLTRRLFLDLGVAAKGSLNASVRPLARLSSAVEAAETVRVGQ